MNTISYEEYEERINESLPRWECGEGYSNLNSETSDSEFAWEFLRRNKEYQSDYFKALTDKQSGRDINFPLHKWGLREFSYDLDPSNTAHPEFYGDRYPVVKYNKKLKRKLLHFIEEHPHKDEKINKKIKRYQKRLEDPRKITLTMKFSVGWNIKRQLETAKELLEIHRQFVNHIGTKNIDLGKLNINPNKGSMKDYLRAYDALYYRNIKLEDAALIILMISKEKSSKEDIKYAKTKTQRRADEGMKLVSFGYKNIIDIGPRSDL